MDLADILAKGNMQNNSLDRRQRMAEQLMSSGSRASNPLIAFLTNAVGSYQMGNVAQDQKKAEDKLQEQAKNAPSQLFEGTSMDAQTYNILATGDPSSPAYKIAYNIAAQPKTYPSPDGTIVTVKPDLSAFVKPGEQRVLTPEMVQSAPLNNPAPMTAQTGQLPPVTTNIDGTEIVRVPSEAAALKNKMDAEGSLRDDYVKSSQPFVVQRDAYNRVKAASKGDASAAGDMSLIFGYMKMLDPTSTVREGEYATAQSAAGVPERILTLYNKAKDGEILGPDQRKDFINQADKLYKSSEGQQKKNVTIHKKLAKQYKVDPDNVAIDLNIDETLEPINPNKPKGKFLGFE